MAERTSVLLSQGDLIAVAAIIVGFGLTVVMFRVQREIWVQENHPEWDSWLAWSDYLILISVLLGFGAVVVVLSFSLLAVASAFCAGAIVLQASYIPAILAHYRIEIGKNRIGDRAKGEPVEKRVVLVAIVAALAISTLVWRHVSHI
jgi:hypothetical protein